MSYEGIARWRKVAAGASTSRVVRVNQASGMSVSETFAWLSRLTHSLLIQHSGKENGVMIRHSCGGNTDYLLKVLTTRLSWYELALGKCEWANLFNGLMFLLGAWMFKGLFWNDLFRSIASMVQEWKRVIVVDWKTN